MAEKRVWPKVVLNPSDADFNLLLADENDLTVKTLGEGGCGYLVSFTAPFELLDEDVQRLGLLSLIGSHVCLFRPTIFGQTLHQCSP